ncbi:MAG TPA: hypothetical protein VHN20_14790 [Beijerinckiaceae bacterium]|nr:hypothetical protein [Beijerinckiaceae bacterium]
MACIATHQDLAHFHPGTAAQAEKPGLLRRLTDAVAKARQNQIDRKLAQYLQRSGGRLTDDIERQMMEQLFGDWNRRA